MNSLSQSDLLTQFCSDFISRHLDRWPAQESKLAEEFVGFFGLKPFASFSDLQQKFQEVGIDISLSAELPTQISGFNGSFAGTRAILINENNLFTREHTLLHEVREMLEHIFCELGRPTAEGILPEEKTEEFAFLVRLAASGEFWKDSLDRTKEIPSKWKRRAVYALIVLGGLGFIIGTILPLLERNAPVGKRYRT